MLISRFSKKNAFTLIELSLVMLVLGFLIVGVMSGRTIIYRSQAQNVMSSVDQYKKAVAIFYDTYGALPDALTFQKCSESSELSALSFCNAGTASEKPPVGNSSTNYYGSNYYSTQSNYSKSTFGSYSNLWSAKVLQAAKLISGVRDMSQKSYLYGNDSTDYAKNGNFKSYYVTYLYGIPTSFDNDVYFQFNYISATPQGTAPTALARGLATTAEMQAVSDTSSFAKNFKGKNSLALINNNKYDASSCTHPEGLAGDAGAWWAGSGTKCSSGVGAVSAYIARIIDQKIDDGIPGTGMVVSLKGYYPSNNTAGADGTPDFCHNFNPSETQDYANGNAKYVTKNQYSKRYGCNMLFALPTFE